ncbi:N-acetyl-gamma-glutamyl-phosphate reductase [Aliiglaciecola sp. CAU 1673]|uniref:N-acetyl-gamma-glutamyl-phosphate reductase n=1 Tax=Aliiglaciecola sp. CAU 1673 TaxID=3032595 RepID=UPI0023DA3E47|nr:N-acetyl-gamma-glutamyl-phosphate reductase [Aliiglaciecola sp. CAU 1673]MDF2178689.1 N-acetyl-gamma-glutamyl-phosphate reductase [Aliiglaciecola sp. CAU 1673]
MKNICILGASGYTGAELAALVAKHPHFHLAGLYVSQGSQDGGKRLSDLYGKFRGLVDLPLQPLDENKLQTLASEMDAIFLATPHEVSHHWVPELLKGKAAVFDLSGAFRLKDAEVFAKYYGFAHEQPEHLAQAVYGLADWVANDIANTQLVAVPGCYPTASITALKPIVSLLDNSVLPIINAVSGVSGAGRKAAINSSFCEVSLQAYGVLGHRHQPEIAQALGTPVIFTPHLGNFKRGILATVTAKVKPGIDDAAIKAAYEKAYGDNPMIRRLSTWPKLDDVVNTAFVDLSWKLDPQSNYLVIGSAIDNLLKGAAAQALQCCNIRFGHDSHLGLLEKAS